MIDFDFAEKRKDMPAVVEIRNLAGVKNNARDVRGLDTRQERSFTVRTPRNDKRHKTCQLADTLASF
jgi:hypothetical protein